MSMQSIRDTFFEECEDLLEALAEGLARMEGGEADSDCLNAVFRAVHSIKGGAGAFALNDLVAFAHRFETVLDEIRSDRLDLSDEVMHVLLRSADHLADQVEAAHEERSIDEDTTAGFLANLDACLRDAGFEAPAADDDFGFSAITLDFGAVPDLPLPMPGIAPVEASAPQADLPGGDHLIRLRPSPQLYANGHDPLSLIYGLEELALPQVTPDLAALPGLEDYDPATPWLQWDILMPASIPLAVLESHFEFIRGLCDLEIRPSSRSLAPERHATETTTPLAMRVRRASENRTRLVDQRGSTCENCPARLSIVGKSVIQGEMTMSRRPGAMASVTSSASRRSDTAARDWSADRRMTRIVIVEPRPTL